MQVFDPGSNLEESTGGAFVGVEFSSIVDDEIRLVKASLEFFLGWSHEHVIHEEAMVWSGAVDSDRLSVLGVPSHETVHDVDFLSVVEVVLGSLEDSFILVSRHLFVDVTPPDLGVFFFGERFHDSLVLWRSSTFFA